MPVTPPELSAGVRTGLVLAGIDPALAAGKLAPFADRLTPALIRRAMEATTWSPNAGGGARLAHLVRWFDNASKSQTTADERKAQRIRQAKTAALRMATVVRARVQDMGMAPWIALWAYALGPKESERRRYRALAYADAYGDADVRQIILEKYPDPLDADWMRAIAWDDLHHASHRTIVGALSGPVRQ